MSLRGSHLLLARKHGATHQSSSNRRWRKSSFDVRSRAALLGVRLTNEEALLLQKRTSRLLPRNLRVASSDGAQFTRDEFHVCRRRFLNFARARQDNELEREAMLATIEQPTEATEIGKRLLPAIGVVGTISWSIAGTQAAGEAGMHLIGCSLVGCISAMGGGTVNNLLFGDAKQGVNWVKNPHQTLMVALAASITTFFVWPRICHARSEKQLEKIHSIVEENSWWAWMSRRLGLGGDRQRITKDQFVTACKSEEFFNEVRKLLAHRHTEISAEELFHMLDTNGDGSLSLDELERLVKLQYDESKVRYMLDTISVGASSVTGTAGAISRGLHPVVCIASSVTLCFGGITRDLICHRDVALGSQSFALCTASGAAVYVLLRELNLRGAALSLGLRILLASGTTVALRIVSFLNDDPLLRPMHDYT